MTRKYCFVLGIISYFFSIFVFAADRPVAVINDLAVPFDLNPYVEYLEDRDHSYSFEDIQAGKYDHLWQVSQGRYFVGTHLASKYWLRIALSWSESWSDAQLSTLKGRPRGGYLYIGNQFGLLTRFHLMLPAANGNTKQIRAGQLEPFDLQGLAEQQYGFYIPASSEQQTIYAWFYNKAAATPALVPLSLVSAEQYDQINETFSDVITVYYAVVLAFLLYNSCLYITVFHKVYGLYVLFLASALIQCSFVDGTLTRFFLPARPELNQHIGLMSNFIISMAYASFVNESLNGVRFWPRYLTVYRVLMVFGLLGAGFSVFNKNYFLSATLGQIYIVSSLTCCLVVIGAAIIRNVPTSRYLLLAELNMACGAICFMLMIQGLLPLNNITFWGIHWGLLGEAMLLSMAVAERTNIVIQEKFQAQKIAYENECRALKALEIATEAKNQFLATVSHELRTPLNSIIGYSDVLMDQHKLNPLHRDYVRTILNNGKQLLTVINGVLNLSLIDSNRVSITKREVDIHRLIRGLEIKYRLLAEKRKLGFEVVLDKRVPERMVIDDEHVAQILQQILENAFKFTHQGQIRLVISLEFLAMDKSDDQVGTKIIKFRLIDSGIGIAADKLQEVFEPFMQADGSNTRRYSGAGVGLFIARSLAEIMGGTISIDSTEGTGTQIELYVPFREISDAADEYNPIDIKIEPLSGVDIGFNKPKLQGRVLYAEDNIDNQNLVKILVEGTGAELIVAEDGEQAIEAVKNSKLPFDLILMDLQMPLVDGYEATSIIRQIESRTPIIACSASALAEIQSESDVLFDGYLGKPIAKPRLYQLLEEFLKPVDD